MKAKVWITNYRPFLIGGDANAPIMCVIDVIGLFDLGKGYRGWLFASPNGKTFVAETETGAIVGNTIENVRKDIETGDENIMKEQVEWAREKVKSAYMASKSEFWERLGGM